LVWDNDNWNMSNWNTTAWDIDQTATNNTGQNIGIAIIDSGMDYSVQNGTAYVHPDLAQNVKGMFGFYYSNGQVIRFWGTVNNASFIQDTRGDGTGAAGVIAAVINGIGVIGIAPNVTIYSLKINPMPYADQAEEEMAAAINFSVELGVKIISISIDFSGNNSHLQRACDNAANNGRLIFVASGDEDRLIWQYPALYSNRTGDYRVSAVGATDQSDTRWSGSNYGPQLDFVAPGDNISTTWLDGTYHLVQGTSFSAPAAAAVAALIWSSKIDRNYVPYGNEWNCGGVWRKMNDTTYDLLPSGGDNDTGWGLVNAWLSNQRPIGDVNGDQIVEGRDVIVCTRAYMTKPEDPRWDPRADVNIDKIVEGRDIAIVTRHYGESDP
jgi:subtilisin